MHIGKSYKLSEFLIWTRRKTYSLFLLGLLPVIFYEVFGLRWLTVPWPVVALLGTATAFTVGFKNTQTYNRAAEGQKIWTDILSLSRYWAVISLDFFTEAQKSKELIYRQLAWLTALRYYLREDRVWESVNKKHNAEYQQFYSIPEREAALDSELARYLPDPELTSILSVKNKATQLLVFQSRAVKALYVQDKIVVLQFVEMERVIKDLLLQQGKSEQLKDSPYPRQYAIINTFFVWLFCVLLPFGILRDFDQLNHMINGPLRGYMVWLVIPFSMLISWMYTSLEQVGESTENPFEGSANDVPISQIGRQLEIELRQMLEEDDLPAELQPQHDIAL
ncbi:bestrophin family protein [Spirosoma jeollabukense]